MGNVIQELEILFEEYDRIISKKGPDSSIHFLLGKLNSAIELRMYQETNHAVPHIHIDYKSRKHSASYEIETGRLLVGTAKKKDSLVVKLWIQNHKEKLLALWNECQAGKDISEQLKDL